MNHSTSSVGDRRRHGAAPAFSWWHLVLLIPFVALLWPGFYAHERPALWGFPFFYWYQFLWVLLSAALTEFVYMATRRRPAR